MKLHFKDQTFSFELLRAVSYAPYGGAELGECLAAAARITPGNSESWYSEWTRTAQRVAGVAARARAGGHRLSAREAYLRASNYYRTTEFFLAPADPRRLLTYEQGRATFQQALTLLDTPVERVRIPYEGTALPGYFYTVDASGLPRPTLLALGGSKWAVGVWRAHPARLIRGPAALFAPRRGWPNNVPDPNSARRTGPFLPRAAGHRAL